MKTNFACHSMIFFLILYICWNSMGNIIGLHSAEGGGVYFEGVKANPLTHSTFDVAHLTAEL
jgi:hypothetical protein